MLYFDIYRGGNIMRYKKIITCLLAGFLLAGSVPTSPTKAASIKIRYSGKTRTYTGTQLKFNHAKKDITNSKYPGIVINGVNMIPYYEYLVTRGPKVKRSYNSKKQQVTLKYGKNTVVMTASSKTYYVNGKKKTLSVAPTRTKYFTTKKTIILLPASATMSALGLQYSYIPAAKRIHINKSGTSYVYTANTTTNYNKTMSSYISSELKQVSSYGSTKLTASKYKTYIDPSKDTTHGYQFLRLNTFRPVKLSTYKSLLNSKVKSGSVLKNKGDAFVSAAKKYKIDPVYFLCQTILETGYGTSTLSQGKSVTKVVSGKSVVKDSKGNVTGFQKVNGKYITKKISSKKVYNLYGIKAYDSDPQLCGFSYAYYMGWTSVNKAITGAAKYVSENYINNTTYKQNTLYKYRYNPNTTYLWHQYATDPAYAKKIGELMYSQFRKAYATGNTLTYDRPKYK